MGASLLSILTLISVIIKIGLSVNYSGGVLVQNTGGESFDIIYDKPYTRIPPYLVGMALGFAMARRPHIRMRPVSQRTLYFGRVCEAQDTATAT